MTQANTNPLMPTPQPTSPELTDSIQKIMNDLPEFLVPIALNYAVVIRKMPEDEFFAFLDLVSADSIDQAAEMLAGHSTLGGLVEMKERLNDMTRRMADQKDLNQQIAKKVMRAAFTAALHAAVDKL